jgi:hypothetical protein
MVYSCDDRHCGIPLRESITPERKKRMTQDKGYGYTNCQYCGTSLKGGHQCYQAPVDADTSGLGHVGAHPVREVDFHGTPISGVGFVYDDCHKFYVCENDDDVAKMKEMWGEDTTIHPMENMFRLWESSCSLKFVSNVSLDKKYVDQFDSRFCDDEGDGEDC